MFWDENPQDGDEVLLIYCYVAPIEEKAKAKVMPREVKEVAHSKSA